MSAFGITQLVRDVKSHEELWSREDELFGAYELEPHELEAVRSADLGALEAMGVHPLSICGVGFLHGMSVSGIAEVLAGAGQPALAVGGVANSGEQKKGRAGK